MNRLTGKPSVDRPWMEYYPPEFANLKVPECTLNEYVRNSCPGMEVPAMHYYGTDITWEEMLKETETVAKALKALGFGIGSQIPVFFHSVPQFISMLLAAEKIGASLVCRDNTIEENAEAVAKTGSKIIFAHDYLSQEDMDVYVEDAGVEKVILLSPYCRTDKKNIPDHIVQNIESLYSGDAISENLTMSWEDFLSLADDYNGEVDAPADIHRPLYRAYTSGSTGTSKQVIHSAHTMLGIIYQMAPYGAAGDFRPSWLLTCLPPCLVAVVVSMILSPLTSNKYLILDPYCDVNDVDLEIMRYKPNLWPLIPMFFEVLMQSERVPKDYDLSHLLAAGAGCEAYNNGQLARSQKFLEEHNCHITFTAAYGQSEAGSNCTFPCPPQFKYGNGNIGIPMPLSNMSIFKPGTTEELGYNELGEICKTGPGNMLGYDNEEATAKALIRHEDGNVWLHTGDIGYVTEEGIFHVLTRGNSLRFDGGRLIALTMENRIIDAQIDGIVDAFFVIAPDTDHKGYFLPYLYVVLEDGYTIDDIREDAINALEVHECPVEIIQLPERPFFHFKTNRIGLTNQLMAAAN
ncbi:MAG: class I adenylate-forming enzyme family protein [Lachnospiraceae bacterium]|nr:class I adenylate-forming enzyme family protein [Lachnospiraceae bacterium]